MVGTTILTISLKTVMNVSGSHLYSEHVRGEKAVLCGIFAVHYGKKNPVTLE